MVLITYHYKSHKNTANSGSFHYVVATSATDWIEEMEAAKYEDGTYVLINVLPITYKQAKQYDGSLQSM